MKRAVVGLLFLTACPGEQQPQYGWQDDPNGGHPVEYRSQPAPHNSLWQNFASGGVGYLLGRAHEKHRSPPTPPPSPTYHAPAPSYHPPPQAAPTHQWRTPPPAPRPSGSYNRPSPSYIRPSYSRPSSSGGARGRYSR